MRAARTSDAIVRLSDAEADRLIDQLVSDVQQYPAVGRAPVTGEPPSPGDNQLLRALAERGWRFSA